MGKGIVPNPLSSGHLCPDCKGTGADIVRTQSNPDWMPEGAYIMCRNCHGNGLDPAAYFRWGPHPVKDYTDPRF